MNKKTKVKGKVKVGRPKKVAEPEVIHKVQFNVTDDWISLVSDPEQADKPTISELHSIIKLATVIIAKIGGFTTTDVLAQVNFDINQNIKDRHKCLVDDWPENQVKDIFKVKEDAFKRYK